MICPACRKKVVFGSIRGEAWTKVLSGDWLLGSTPPAFGVLGDCPACGLRLEWEPGEAPTELSIRLPARVHLFALRESTAKFDGMNLSLRAIVVEHEERAFLSDSWRNKKAAESDAELLGRLAREQAPLVRVDWPVATARERFLASSAVLAGGRARAAWAEIVGSFRAAEATISVEDVTSVWPPKE